MFHRLYTSLFLVLLSSMSAAADFKVEARRDGDAVMVEARARVRADVETAWDVLTDYDRYAEFIPDLKSSEILARVGDTAIVHQKGEAGFFLFHFPVEVTLSVTERPPTGISSRAISGTFKEMTGAYTLAQDDGGVRLTYSGRLVPEFRLPPLIGTAAVKVAVERQFGALVKEIQRRAAVLHAPLGDTR
ncbi:MAG TPA: SRPBCC family protein [Burkholderiales bacterium]|nr:SRPBCC family protein [Burkholderiales bacterium]